MVKTMLKMMTMKNRRIKKLPFLYTEFIKPGASMESMHCGQDKRIFCCPVIKCLDSMLAPGFMNWLYIKPTVVFNSLKQFWCYLLSSYIF